jgi:hypothetical protein
MNATNQSDEIKNLWQITILTMFSALPERKSSDKTAKQTTKVLPK